MTSPGKRKKSGISPETRSLIRAAIREDLDEAGDLTSQALIAPSRPGEGLIRFRKAGVLCGIDIVEEVYRQIDRKVKVKKVRRDGQFIRTGEDRGLVASVTGPARSILTGERTALNFLQILGGIATGVHHTIRKLPNNSRIRLLDTRKTMPGWRRLSKYAVRKGSNGRVMNHRMGLYDAIMIKDNHLQNTTITEAVRRIRRSYAKKYHITVEADSLEQVEEALGTDAERILLDNMDVRTIRKAVRLIRSSKGGKKREIELSGGIRPEDLRRYVAIDVDFISMGCLALHTSPIDVGLDWKSGTGYHG